MQGPPTTSDTSKHLGLYARVKADHYSAKCTKVSEVSGSREAIK